MKIILFYKLFSSSWLFRGQGFTVVRHCSLHCHIGWRIQSKSPKVILGPSTFFREMKFVTNCMWVVGTHLTSQSPTNNMETVSYRLEHCLLWKHSTSGWLVETFFGNVCLPLVFFHRLVCHLGLKTQQQYLYIFYISLTQINENAIARWDHDSNKASKLCSSPLGALY